MFEGNRCWLVSGITIMLLEGKIPIAVQEVNIFKGI